MKICIHLSLLALVNIFIYSCSQPSIGTKTNNQSSITASFDTLAARFKDQTLPIVIYPCPGGVHFGNYTKYKSIDSAIGEPFHIGGYCLAYGKIKTNREYTALITLGLADCLGVEIHTFDSTGKPIDNKYIGIGQCGSGPGFSCTEVVKINSDYSIYAADSITEQEIDSTYMPIPGGKIFSYVIYKKGKLLTNGHIELSADMRDTLKVQRDTSSTWVRPQ